MEEARTAIAEILNVTHRVDDKFEMVDNKVTELIDGGKDAFLYLLITETYITRSKRSKSRGDPVTRET
jgi:hypothetical protein